MPGGGTLTVTTRNVSVDRRADPSHPEIAPGSYVQLCIADTGHGMDAETKFRAFDPFFTTKPVGQGTGLGLSTTYGVIMQSDGHIFVDSSPGSGATFRIYLKRVEATPAPAPSHAETRLTGGRETVLLVEDEEALRRFLKVLLESAGYTVLDAPGGEQALMLDAEHATPIHLLLTDVVMAGMSGSELAELFRQRRRNAAVLLMSGYAQNAAVQHTRSATGAVFIQKPFTPGALLARVREVLDR
jgi:CheY-like chemotaxis protein